MVDICWVIILKPEELIVDLASEAAPGEVDPRGSLEGGKSRYFLKGETKHGVWLIPTSQWANWLGLYLRCVMLLLLESCLCKICMLRLLRLRPVVKVVVRLRRLRFVRRFL